MDTSKDIGIAERIALHLKHDSSCAVEKSGVCTCWFYDVANQVVQVFEEYLKSKKIIIDIDKMSHYEANELKTYWEDWNYRIDSILEGLEKEKCNCHYQCGCNKGECNCYKV